MVNCDFVPILSILLHPRSRSQNRPASFLLECAHVDPADSMLPASSATSSNNIWDCFHVNSVEEGPNNTLLISMRNMWAIYNIDKETENINWQLGGKQSNFTFGPNATFSWQHDARYRPGNRISMFDDACCASSSSPPDGPAHGLILQLDFQNMTANVDRTYCHDPTLYVASQGNLGIFIYKTKRPFYLVLHIMIVNTNLTRD